MRPRWGSILTFKALPTCWRACPDVMRPAGRLLIAWVRDEAAGIVALRPMAENVCEMKRLYLRPPAWRRSWHAPGRGDHRRGRQLATRRCDSTRFPKLEAAARLYESLGFVRRDAYYETPVAETIFMEMRL